ncbi:sensor histidine kinase [Streptacidiphilus sp. MAP5-3]|uniref:sensor histidine kinase n=1 Tax=unclassified Streptacidiphilus TaxID=2643834 RepID=UPI0035171417
MDTAAPPPRAESTAHSRRRDHVSTWLGLVAYPIAMLVLLYGIAARAEWGALFLGALLTMFLLVPAARRRPVLTLGVTLPLVCLMIAAIPGRDRTPLVFLLFVVPDILLGVIVGRCRRSTGVWAAVVSLVVQVLMVAAFSRGPDAFISTEVLVALGIATAYTMGLLARERREHAEATRAQAVAEAVTAERLRIARELHDMVAHSIGIIAIQAGMGSRVVHTQPAEAQAALSIIETTSRETLAGLRRTLVALRRSDADPTAASSPDLSAPAPSLTDLDRLAEATAAAGVRVTLRRVGEARPLPPDIELSAYRIVQEAVTNVVRHADTPSCTVDIAYGAQDLTLTILDSGRGTSGLNTPNSPNSPNGVGAGFGITGMRERTALLGGTLTAGPHSDGGFQVTARLPLPADTAQAAVG